MPYDVHIHRAENFWDAAENPIPRDEWQAWVENAADFAFSPTDYVTFEYEDGEQKERLAVWTEHPGGEEFALYYYAGSVVTGNPDGDTVRRMVAIAAQLDARLQGDDGEFYGSNGEPQPTGS
jgi:hypothetical protein